jgi:ADP-ribose pyrophosphatase YjhB (NUDIX family)/ribosomal protein S18 acetylase RimI-like enzyme
MADLQYCPVCGHALGEREEGGRVRQACDNCGYVHYLNPVPAVGLLIEKDGGLVLIRRSNPPHQGAWALPSGYIEADESAEDAAVREAFEETGLHVELIEMAGVNSFPEGPPRSGIMIFFRARARGGELTAGDDASEARIFTPQDMPLLPFRTHREAVAVWLERARRATEDTQHPRLGANDYEIRPAENRDADQIMALLGMIPANRGLSADDRRAAYFRFRELNNIEVFVAEVQQDPPIVIGFIALSVVRTLTESRGLINDMAVLPTFQRRGVGAALLEAVMRRAQRLDLRTLMINEQRANDRAKAFYAALGFSPGEIMQLRLR